MTAAGWRPEPAAIAQTHDKQSYYLRNGV